MRWKLGVGVVAACVLAGCASPSHRAPVEDRGGAVGRGAAGVAGLSDPARPLPGAENAGKPGYYTVRPGDTLIRIGLDTGQNWRDIVRWNSLDNPNVIEVGQVLRVAPPASEAATTVASVRPVAPPRVETRPLDGRTPMNGEMPASQAAVPAVPAVPAASAAAAAPKPIPVPVAAAKSDEDIAWAWPAGGSVVAPFDETRNKGLGIAGKAGDPVLAAADGRVVYAGSGLRGYGNLVIVKHNNTYLTAYAHNQTLLVKEDQTVRRGQKIAEMGSTDADRVKLHFEIRRQGKPVDPARFLPTR